MKKTKPFLLMLLTLLFFGCKNTRDLDIQILPLNEMSSLNELIEIYAEDYKMEDGKIKISFEKLLDLELQLQDFMEINISNVDIYFFCKQNQNQAYEYACPVIEKGEI